jgi:putative tryptophan/tyrosine transport system substrate-binding protein
MATGADPVGIGLVQSLSRPSGNVTGLSNFAEELASKQIDAIHYTETETEISDARFLKLQLHVVRATSVTEFETAFREIKDLQTQALLVSADLFLHSQREKIVSLAATHALPTIYPRREYVTAGGMMSYGPSLLEVNRLIATADESSKAPAPLNCRSSNTQGWSL